MNREIKYRGKTKSGKWVYGSLLIGWAGTCQIWEKDEDNALHNYLVDANSVSEFTGLRDKNGKEIYEKDIIACDFLGRNIGNYTNILQVMHTLEWDKMFALNRKEEFNPFMSSWGATDNKTFYCFMNIYDPTRYATVLGNIIDNPELFDSIA